MADSVVATIQMLLTGRKVYTPAGASIEQAIVLDAFNLANKRLTATTTPPATQESYQEYALVAGSKTIDLTSLVNSLGVTFSGVGLKVQGFIFVNPAGNSAINIAPGGSNPYPLFGASNDITVPGHATEPTVIQMYLPEGTPDIASGVKNIDFTGTGTETFQLGLILG